MILAVQLAASKQRQRGRRLRTVTETKSQGNETCVTGGRKLYVVLESNTGGNIKICHATLLLFFFSTVIKFYSPVKICLYLNRVQCLQISHNCDNENRQCADNHCP